MNCIFYSIFNNEKYIDIFYLFLESIFIYGNLNDTIHILVYTSTKFMNIIKESHLFNDEKIKFEINDNNNDKKTISIFNLFNLQSISSYEKILYLNTDILVKDDINKVFDFLEEDEENYDNIASLTSEILLFKNSEKINISNIFKYNNKFLNSSIVNKVIHNFTRQYNDYDSKIENMNILLNNLKDFTITNNIHKTMEYINHYLLPIIHNSGELLEGNIFMNHLTTIYNNNIIVKAKNISNILLNKNIKNVMEIGFNSGFSTLLMLLTNPTMNITCFDLGEHKYTLPCYEKLKETFGDRINIIIGDSIETLKNINENYDLIHIDGCHTTEVANIDITNSIRLSKNRTILIMDDYNIGHLHKLWDSYIRNYSLKSLNINLYNTELHDIKYILKFI